MVTEHAQPVSLLEEDAHSSTSLGPFRAPAAVGAKPSKKKNNNLEKAMVAMCEQLSSTTTQNPVHTASEKRRISFCNFIAAEVMLMTEEQFLRFFNGANNLVSQMAQEHLPQRTTASTETSRPIRPSSAPTTVASFTTSSSTQQAPTFHHQPTFPAPSAHVSYTQDTQLAPHPQQQLHQSLQAEHAATAAAATCAATATDSRVQQHLARYSVF